MNRTDAQLLHEAADAIENLHKRVVGLAKGERWNAIPGGWMHRSLEGLGHRLRKRAEELEPSAVLGQLEALCTHAHPESEPEPKQEDDGRTHDGGRHVGISASVSHGPILPRGAEGS